MEREAYAGSRNAWEDWFPARLAAKTGTSPILYAWVELSIDPSTGQYADANPGRSGTVAPVSSPAYEMNNQDVDVDTVVQMRMKGVKGGAPIFEFDGSAGTADAIGTVTTVDGTPSYSDIHTLKFDEADGFVITGPSAGIARIDLTGATVEELDGSPSYTDIRTFQFDSADGFVVTNPSSRTARIDIAAATRTTAGVVVANTQTFGGIKTFDSVIHAGDGVILHYGGEANIVAGTYGSISNTNGGGGADPVAVVMQVLAGFTRSLSLQLTAEESGGANARLDLYTGDHGAIDVFLSNGTTLVQTGTATVSGLSFLSGFYLSGTLSVGSGDIAGGAVGTTQLADNAVTDAKLRDSGALSVIGRSANSTGDPADISAVAASGAVLRESGSTLGFGTIATAGIADSAVTYAKVQDVSATARALGRKTAGAGVVEELTLSELLDFVGSAAQGDVLYRGAATWARLGAGTAHQVLKTGGAGANPSWANVDGGTW